MIIPGQAMPAPCSPASESHGIREEDNGFGQLLTEVERGTTRLPEREDEERRALASVLQVLLNMFSPSTTVDRSAAVSVPGTEDADSTRVVMAGSPPPGLLPAPVSAPPPEETRGIALRLGMVPDSAPGSALLSAPALVSSAPTGEWRHAWRTASLMDLESAPATSAARVATQGPEQPAQLTSPDAVTPPPSPLSAASTVPGVTMPYLPEESGSQPPVLQTAPIVQTAGDSYAPQTLSLVQADTALLGHEHVSFPRRPLTSAERTPEVSPGLSSLPGDHAVLSPPIGVTSHTPVSGTDGSLPTLSQPFADVLEPPPWPRPLPSNTLLLHLEPQELGTLLVQVRMRDKHLSASFHAESPDAEALLRLHLPALHASLSQQGFEVQPIVITQGTEGFSTHLGAGTGTFTHQHSAFQALTQDQAAAGSGDTPSEGDVSRTPPWSAEPRPHLLDVVI